LHEFLAVASSAVWSKRLLWQIQVARTRKQTGNSLNYIFRKFMKNSRENFDAEIEDVNG